MESRSRRIGRPLVGVRGSGRGNHGLNIDAGRGTTGVVDVSGTANPPEAISDPSAHRSLVAVR
jgi:hypothetical protein